jgi:flagellar M-ring protein FliF
MKGTSRLSVNQVLAIQHLVASSVPDLSIDKISIVDDKGTLLAKGQETDIHGGDSLSAQHDIRMNFEGKLSRTIESLLEKTLGPGHARAEISADMDFDKMTSTSVEFNPDGQVARSIQSTSEGVNANEASGNDAVTVQNAIPEAGQGASGANSSKNQTNRSEENSNFEISNVTKNLIKESGTIKRLSIAVLVDGTYATDAEGKQTYTPRPQEEITQITDLVKTAVGFKEDRGDIIKVVNMRFAEIDTKVEEISAVDKLMGMIMNPKVIEIFLLCVTGLILFFVLIRPIMRRAMYSSVMISNSANAGVASNMPSQMLMGTSDGLMPEAIMNKGNEALNAAILKQQEQEALINLENIDGRVKSSSVKKISEIIERHPADAAAIMRNWMRSE